MAEALRFAFERPADFDPKGVEKFLTEAVKPALREVAALNDFSHDALEAAFNGILEGHGLKPKDLTSDEETGYNIVVRACKSPIVQIVQNAGENGEVVANKVLENKTSTFGYDARKGEYCDMVKEGIIDPTKVVPSALENAASVSTLLLTSDALVADLPKDEKKKDKGGDDMY